MHGRFRAAPMAAGVGRHAPRAQSMEIRIKHAAVGRGIQFGGSDEMTHLCARDLEYRIHAT
jgi:hypothetical protein